MLIPPGIKAVHVCSAEVVNVQTKIEKHSKAIHYLLFSRGVRTHFCSLRLWDCEIFYCVREDGSQCGVAGLAGNTGGRTCAVAVCAILE